MTPTKLALAGTAMFALLLAFAFQRTPAPLVLPTEQSIMAKNARTLALAQMPFETPSWVPDEATKKKALMRAYHMNGGSMVGDHMIDVSKQEGIVADPDTVNELDEQAQKTAQVQEDKPVRRHGPHAVENTCTKKGLQKVEYGGHWRCRKKK
jgi:hypothetical protein